ncbi:MAG: glutamine amidotransferase-related protein [Desulfobacterales bacterium]
MGKPGGQLQTIARPQDIKKAETLIFPGVGNFGSMMRVLNEKGYVEALLQYLKDNRSFLGICLGLHALFQKSTEAPDTSGLGFIKGTVRRFETKHPVPHIGWNGVNIQKTSFLMLLIGWLSSPLIFPTGGGRWCAITATVHTYPAG